MKARAMDAAPDFDFPPVDRDRGYDVIDAMRPIAETHGVSVAQIALAWLLHQDVVTSVHHRGEKQRPAHR